jgi:hypothetical protein
MVGIGDAVLTIKVGVSGDPPSSPFSGTSVGALVLTIGSIAGVGEGTAVEGLEVGVFTGISVGEETGVPVSMGEVGVGGSVGNIWATEVVKLLLKNNINPANISADKAKILVRIFCEDNPIVY